MTCMSPIPDSKITGIDSAAVASTRRIAQQALFDLERSWIKPHPDEVVSAARRYLAAAENWADSRREGA